MKWILAILLIFTGTGVGFIYYATETYFIKPIGNGNQSIHFEIKSGESFQSITKRLEENKIIEHPELLNLLSRIYSLREKIKAGEYVFKNDVSPKSLLQIFIIGKGIDYPFTVTEGLNSFEIAANFEQKGFGKKEEFIRTCADSVMISELLNEKIIHCEGYLFPDTYNFAKKTSARQMISVMIKAFIKNYTLIAQGRNLGGWSRHQILTFASLIEKETGAAQERPMIASVFFNRLQKGIRLQTDPTVQYGILAINGVYPLNITKKDLITPTPYNTYTKAGLPPGPISNPGRESLRAVFEPSKTDFLFFVSRNNGTHVFSKTYEEHQQAVKNFQLDPKARQGKSWRDLAK